MKTYEIQSFLRFYEWLKWLLIPVSHDFLVDASMKTSRVGYQS